MFHPAEKAIELANPIASTHSQMRLSLVTGLLQALAGNYHRQHRQIRLFETGSIYYLDNNQRGEVSCLGAISTGYRLPEQWGVKSQPLDFYDLKADIEALG